MKNYIVLSILLTTLFLANSCKKIEKKTPEITKKGYTLSAEATTVNWIAFKTTDKVPVKGTFEKLIIENSKKSATKIEALNNIKFNIPVNSLFTNDSIRDGKLKKFFFGTMSNTSNLTGTIKIADETTGFVELKMNAIAHKLPITYSIIDKEVTIKATMNLDNWQAQLAIKALNEVCNELHTGPDGIAKTWNEVEIEATTTLNYN